MPDLIDHYSQCEESAATLLLSLSGDFFPNARQVSRGDDSVLGSIGADYFAILHPGAHPKKDASPVDAVYDWQIIIDLYARYKNEMETNDNLKKLRSAVINLFTNNRDTFGGTPGVVDISYNASDQMQYVMSSGNPDAGPAFKVQRTLLTVTQYVTQSI